MRSQDNDASRSFGGREQLCRELGEREECHDGILTRLLYASEIVRGTPTPGQYRRSILTHRGRPYWGWSSRTRIQWSVLPFLWTSAGASLWVRLFNPASMTVCVLSPTVQAARCVSLSTAP